VKELSPAFTGSKGQGIETSDTLGFDVTHIKSSSLP
jgi:hypothetical protein